MMAETCERMVQAGLPLWRVGVFIQTLHPDIFGRNFIWRLGEEVEMGTVDFGVVDSPGFMSSPLAIVFTEGKEVRGRLDELQGGRFPIFADLHAEGVTDCIALPLLFIDGSIHASNWTTKQPGGFSDQQLSALRSLIPPLAVTSEARWPELPDTPMPWRRSWMVTSGRPPTHLMNGLAISFTPNRAEH